MNGIQNKPSTTTPTIPPNYGTLYDNGQLANNEQTATQIPIQQQQALNGVVASSAAANTAATTSQLNLNKPSEGLPGLLEFPDEGEDSLLSNICSANQLNYQFKLAPVYTMYMMLRFRLSQKYKSDLSFNDKLHSSALLIHKMVNYIREAVDTNHSDKQILPFWLANSSELLYFLKQDIHLSQVSYDAQELLADCVQITFKYLVNLMQQQLDYVLIAFFDPSDHVEEMNNGDQADDPNSQMDTNNMARPTLKHIIQVLNETMNLLRGSRVNAALTIQLFSQLFHYISVWMFNKLISDQRSGLCSRYWGAKLTRRLNKIQQWAEKQGLELAADCHLSRIIQAAFFLQSSKQDCKQDLPTISSNCFALNSLQIKGLLNNYVIGMNEPTLSSQLCNNLIAIAQNTADEVVKQEGRNLQLHEEVDLQLPFLLPEDGHSCDIIKGLPACLLDFLEILQNSGQCWLWQNTQGPGSWKKFMIKEQQQPNLQQPTLSGSSTNSSATNTNSNINNMTTIMSQPLTRPAIHTTDQNGINKQQQQIPTTPLPVPVAAVVTTPVSKPDDTIDFTSQSQQQELGPTVVKLKLSKKNNGLGLSIVAARGTNQINSGIYVKSVVPGGAADDDGRLDAGDQLLAVDEASLINVTQERAAELMCKSGPIVILTVAKEAAYFHDLDALLNKSPLPPVSKQQSMTASMPLLNNLNGNGMISNPIINNQQQQPPQSQFSSVTLPRNHLQQQQQQQSQPIAQPQMNKVNGFNNHHHYPQQQQPHQNGFAQQLPIHQNQVDSVSNINNGYRVRSMSQEILKSNGINNNNQTHQQLPIHQLPINKVQTRQNNNQVTSPIRALPNEHMRYGSERPVSMHGQQYHINNQTNGNVNSNGFTANLSQRNLHNEFGPRYGSERPASALASNFFNNQQQQQGLSAVQRLNGNTSNSDLVSSPIRQVPPPAPLPVPIQNGKFNGRQASLSELDEINYNNQNENQIKFDELYGRVNNANRQSANHLSYQPTQQQQYQSLNGGDNNFNNFKSSRTNSLQEPVMVTEEQRTINKPFGQLYEQIWANNQNNGSNQQQFQSNARLIQQQQQHQPQRNIEDLNNFKNMEISNGYQQQRFIQQDAVDANNIRNKPPPASLISSLSRTNMMNGNGPHLEFGQNRQLPRNYENQIINHQQQQLQQQQQQQQRQNIAKPIIPSKPFNLNTINNNSEELTQQQLPPPAPVPIQSVLANAATAKLVVNNNLNNKWEKEQLNRIREDEETRLDLLHQRIELLHTLETKTNRTNEEENKLNKLRTEIEFDKRVIEMNNQNLNNYLHDNEETETDDYSPDVRERLASQMLKEEFMQRRRKLEELNGNEETPSLFHAQKIDKRFVQFENTQNEIKREEARNKINQPFNNNNNNNSNNNCRQNGNHFMTENIKNGYTHTNGNGNSNGNGHNGNHHNHNHHQYDHDSNHSDEQNQIINNRPQKHVQFMNDTEILSPKYIANGKQQSTSSSSSSPEHKQQQQIQDNNVTPQHQQKRVMFSETSKFLEFERIEDNNQVQPNTPCVIGANEIYVDQRLKQKQQQQQQQQMANMFIEGEKLSFKDKMKLFAMQSGDHLADNAENKFKNSKKQREIESKFEIK